MLLVIKAVDWIDVRTLSFSELLITGRLMLLSRLVEAADPVQLLVPFLDICSVKEIRLNVSLEPLKVLRGSIA